MPGPVSVTETAKWPFRAPAAMLTSPASVNLMALPTRLSSTCVRRCSSPRPTGSDLSTDVVSVSFLFCASDSVAARTVSTTLSIAYSVMFRVNWPDSILAMSSTVLMRPSKCLPLERIRVSASREEETEERWWEAEIYRLQGTLLLRHSIVAPAAAETWLKRAFDVACQQKARSLELRAAT